MANRDGEGAASRQAPANFATTQWSMVLKAGRVPSPVSDQALESLCQLYWYPLYAFVRRKGVQANDAQDLTQEFFANLLERDFLQQADPSRGRFRSFLLTAFQRFLVNEHERAHALKRGGGRQSLSLDFRDGEGRLAWEPDDTWTPERVFQRRWALTVLDGALKQLRDDYIAKGKEVVFDQTKKFLSAPPAENEYERLAAELGISVPALKVTIHRLRERYRDVIRQAVSATVEDESAIDEEISDLLAALR